MGTKKRGLLRRSAYDSLKAMIVTGQLPPGTRVLVEELAAKLNVSRTPIREALNQLERDGLVTERPRQGYAVKEFDITMFRESFELRELLDGYATELATARLTPADKELLKGMLRSVKDWQICPTGPSKTNSRSSRSDWKFIARLLRTAAMKPCATC